MKKLLTILLLCYTGLASAQTVPGYVRPGLFYGVEYYRIKPDSAMGLPRKTTLRLNTTDVGPQAFILNDTAFVWYANGQYHVLGQNGVTTQIIDTSSLSNRINQRVQYGDTAAMLNPYLKKIIADQLYYPLTSNPAGYSVLPSVANALQVINAGAATSIQAGTYAARPAAGVAGRSYIATDSAAYYYDNGVSWVRLGGTGGGGAGLSYPLSAKRYLNGYGSFPQLNTDSIFEGLNLFFTNARARAAISLTTTGSGTPTYSNTTGILNIPPGLASLANVGGGYPTAYAGTGNVKSWYFSGLINDTTTTTNANRLRVDSGLYATHRYIDSLLRTYAGVADTFVIAGQGAGQRQLYANMTDTLKTKNLGNGLWTKSFTNTDSSLRVDIDSLFVHSGNWVLDMIARFGGGGGGPAVADTFRLIGVGQGTMPAFARQTDTLFFKRHLGAGGIIIETLTDSTERFRVDSSVIATPTYVTNYVTNVFNDTTRSSLQKVMDNSSFLTTTHNIGGAKQIVNSFPGWTFTWGIGLGNRFGAFPTDPNYTYIYNDSLYKNNAAGSPRNLERIGGGLDPVINVYDSTDSAHTVYVWNSGRRYVTTYSGGTGGSAGGGIPTWEQVLSSQTYPAHINSHGIDMTGGLDWITNDQTGGLNFIVPTSVSGLAKADRAVTSNVTIDINDDNIEANATSANLALSLAGTLGGPTPINGGLMSKSWTIVKTDGSGHTVTISAAGGTINGASTYTLTTQWQRVTITEMVDQTNYMITAQ